jgi:sulfur-oxidizing protein SoxX
LADRRALPCLAAALLTFQVQGDAIPLPLTGHTGDPAQGRRIVLDRQVGTCLLCHTGPFPEERFQGSIGPDLTGVGSRLSEGQLRLRLVDPQRLNPESVMPAYYKTEGRIRVAKALQDRPVLNAAQIEDVVAFLATLRAP